MSTPFSFEKASSSTAVRVEGRIKKRSATFFGENYVYSKITPLVRMDE